MSGATVRTIVDRFYSLTLSTPCISFATDPETGESGEQEFHTSAREQFDRMLEAVRKPVAELVEELGRKLGLPLLPFDADLPDFDRYRRGDYDETKPCVIGFLVSGPGADLKLTLSRVPSTEVLEAIEQTFRVEFEKRIRFSD